MFTKEAQELAEATVEAIKKISRNYYNSVSKLPGGGLSETEWEWEPKVGETCIVNWNSEPMIIYAVEENKQIVYASRFTATDESNGYRQDIKHLTPILDWENDIEEILKGIGYIVSIDEAPHGETPDYRFAEHFVWIIKRSKVMARGSGKDRQEAVQRAILALLEQLEERE